ncbi:MAG: TonB-dependent receptor [Acidobacteriota bacterium]|nr:TonB-dependent receptor [Acidobacteriota bacterium]
MQGRAAQYSVAGGRPEGQAILLDDESLQNFWNTGIGSISGSSLGIEAIGEFQTLTNSYGAQFGGNGAVINAVSKSGTNAFHGSAFDFLRNSAFDARDFFSKKSTAAPFRRNQFGGSVGGPVKKNKAFFFVDYEGVRELLEENKTAIVPNCPSACTITATDPATRAAIANTLALYPKPDPGTISANGLTGTAATYGNRTIHEDYVLARFDYTFSEKDSMFVRYFSDKAAEIEPFAGAGAGTGGGPLPYWPGHDQSHSQYSTIEERHILTPNVINLARFSFSRPTKNSDEPNAAVASNGTTPLQFYGTAASLPDGLVNMGSGITPVGAAYATGRFNLSANRYTLGDDVLWNKGANSIRFGLSVARVQNNTFDPLLSDAVWSFTSLANFLAGTVQSVQAVVPTAGNSAYRDYRQTQIAPYLQDDWKVTPKLTVNAGVRWEFVSNPTERLNRLYAITDFAHSTGYTHLTNVFLHNPSWKNFDPRVGIAYDPFSNHKTSIRAGFGLFHDPINVLSYQTGFAGATPWAQSTQPGALGATYPNAPTSTINIPPAALVGWDPNIKTTPYMIQYNLNIQREIAAGTVLTVGYVGSHGVHLMTGVEQNSPVPTIDSNGVYHFTNAAGVQNARRNPALGTFSTPEPISSSRYHSLQTIVNRRFSHNVEAQLAYTWSKCIDNGAFAVGSFNGITSTPAGLENPYNQSVDRGPCSYDTPHVLRANTVASLPFHGNRLVEGWQISGIVSAYSGLPFNVYTGYDRAGLGPIVNYSRPNYVYGCDPYAGAKTVNQWFNPNCYTLQDIGTLGNTGRNSLRGPGYFNMDVSLLKDTRITEQFKLQFRAEFFNVLNHENFALPGSFLFSSAGRIGTAGQITQTSGNSNPRQIQFGLKLNF